ncbi:SRPBCC family protein [Nocardioides zeae]|uniref:SRPBCC family protein n=1 Tax=Nocardioides imazamoxiresistens TaxID=3231893 RepID=A0ABU3PW03_9ACTN|nr:SRPBCC family protein [Nocardioides zeae]MDT9593422.1 SRPBCC family protein [Nocardioides zeae]
MDPQTLTFADSITVQAPPEAVYAAVSDVTRTGEWSPVCRACWWHEGEEGPRVGARFTGRNETPDRTWETTSEVVAAEPGRRFAWSVGPGLVTWTYDLEATGPDGSQTRLTQSWEWPPNGQAFAAEKFPDQPAVEQRHRAAREGIPVTLAAIKRVVEGA